MNLKKLTASVLIAVMAFSASAFAADKKDETETKTVITYDKAVEMAIKNTSSLKTIDEAVELMEDNKEMLFTSLNGYLPLSGVSHQVESSIGNLLESIGSIDGSTKSYKYKKIMLKETAELMVKNYFNTIVTSEKSLELAKESLVLKQRECNELIAKNKLGMVSDNELDTAKNEVTTLQQNVKMAELAIDNVYDELANAIGLKVGEEFEIDYEITYEPLTITTSLESYITVKSQSEPSVVAAKADVESADFQKKVSITDDTPYSYEEKTNALNAADRTYGDTVKNIKTSILNGYNTIMQLESKEKTLQTALDDAKRTYDTAKTNFEVGNITQLKLDQASLAVKNAENDLLSNASSHDLLVFQFNHPYMLSGSGSGADAGK